MLKRLIIVPVFTCAFFLNSFSGVSAKTIVNDKGVANIAKNEIINDDLFIGAQSADVEGTVNGDVFVGAQTVKITGIINGNLHAGANTIFLNGTVKGNVYAGAQNIFVSGSVIGGSILAGGASVDIDKTTSVGGSILAGAGTLTIDSQVKRSIYAGTGSLTIGGDAKIGKDLYYATGKDKGKTNISADAKIAGTTYKSEINPPQNNFERASLTSAKKKIPAVIGTVKIFTTVISFFGALAVGFICLKLFNDYFSQTTLLISKSFWKTFGTGFLVTISFVPGLLILAATMVGLPLAGLAILLLLVYSYLAQITVGMAVGNWLGQKNNWKISAFWTLALGLAIIHVVNLVPFIGFLSGLAVLWTGLGAFTLRTFVKTN